MASLAPTFGRGAMTNSWIDIKNTDLVVIMGGNAAEAHPCGFKWVTEAKATRGAKLIVIDPRFTRSASVADFYAPIRQGTDIAFLLGVISYLHPERQDPARIRARLHQRAVHRQGGLRLSGRPVHRLRRGQARLRSLDLGIRDRPRRLRHGRRHAAASALRLSTAEGPCGTVHAGNGRAHLRHAEGQVSDDLPDDLGDLGARQGHDVHVRARLDSAFQGLAEHPHHGDAAASARQYRRARRRHECPARPFQHPGTDRYRADVGPDPGIPHAPDGQGTRLRDLHVRRGSSSRCVQTR